MALSADLQRINQAAGITADRSSLQAEEPSVIYSTDITLQNMLCTTLVAKPTPELMFAIRSPPAPVSSVTHCISIRTIICNVLITITVHCRLRHLGKMLLVSYN